MNENKSKDENFTIALNEHQINPLLSNFVNSWEVQRYTDGHCLLTG